MLFIVAPLVLTIPFAWADYESYYGSALPQFLRRTWQLEKQAVFFQLFANLLDGNVTIRGDCAQALFKLKSSFARLEPSSLEIIDSSGTLLPGALSGNLINLGNFDKCTSRRNNYCRVKLSGIGGKQQDSSFTPHNAPIIYTVCMPRSCEQNDLSQVLNSGSHHREGPSYDVKCHRNEHPYGPLEVFGTVFFSVILLTTLVSTVYDLMWANNYTGANGLWCSFSIKRSLRDMLNDSPNKYTCIDGLRALFQIIVILYHVWRDILKNIVPVMNKFELNQLLRSLKGSAIVNAPFSVEGFTVIGGFVVTYSVLSKQPSKINIPYYLLNRFLRIYPTYIIGLIFMLSLSGTFCDGPLCDNVIYARQDTCKQVWWTNVLLINNVYPGLTGSCMSHTWYVAADMQLNLFLTPLLIVGLRWNKKTTVWCIVATAIGAAVYIFYLTVLRNLPTETLSFDRFEDAERYYNSLYTPAYGRIPSWCIGLLFGIFTYHQKTEKLSVCKELLTIYWILFGLLTISPVLANLPFQQESYTYNSIEAGLYNALAAPLWSLGFCWLIFACSSGYADGINSFLSGSLFKLLGKLSYSTFLVHKIVVNYYFSGIRTPIYVSLANQAILIVGLSTLSFVAAFFVFLFIEAPFSNVTKFIIQWLERSEGVQLAAIQTQKHQQKNEEFELKHSDTKLAGCLDCSSIEQIDERP